MSRTNFVRHSLAENKVHFTLYKAGKRWLAAGITVSALGLALGVPQTAAAATAPPDKTVPTVTAATENKPAAKPADTADTVVQQPAEKANTNSAVTTNTQSPVAGKNQDPAKPAAPQTAKHTAAPAPAGPVKKAAGHTGTVADTNSAYQHDSQKTDQANQQAQAANTAKAALQKLLDQPKPDDARWTAAINQALKTYQTAATAFTGDNAATEQAIKDYQAAIAAYTKNGGPNQGAIAQITPPDTAAKTDAAKLAAYEKQVQAVQAGLGQISIVQKQLAAYKSDQATYAAAQQVIAANRQLTQTITGLNGALSGIAYNAKAGDVATVTQLLRTLDLIKGQYDTDVAHYQALAAKFNATAEAAAQNPQAQHPQPIDTSSLASNPTDQQYQQFTQTAATVTQTNQDRHTVDQAYTDAENAYQTDIKAPQQTVTNALTAWQQAKDRYNQTLQAIAQQPNAKTDGQSLANQTNALTKAQTAAQQAIAAYTKQQANYQQQLAAYQTALDAYTTKHHLAHQNAGSVADAVQTWQKFAATARQTMTSNNTVTANNTTRYNQAQNVLTAFQNLQQQVTAINQAAQAQSAAADAFNQLANQINTTGHGTWNLYNDNPSATNAAGQPVADNNIVALGNYLIDKDFAYLNAVYDENYQPDTKTITDIIDSGAKITRTYVENHLYPGTAGRTNQTLQQHTGSYANIVAGFNQALSAYTSTSGTAPTDGHGQPIQPLADTTTQRALQFEQDLNGTDGFIAQFNKVAHYVADHSADKVNNATLHQQLLDPNIGSTNGSTPNTAAEMYGPKSVDISILISPQPSLAGLAGVPMTDAQGDEPTVYATGAVTHPTSRDHPDRTLTAAEINNMIDSLYSLDDGAPVTLSNVMTINHKTYYLAGFYANEPTQVVPEFSNVNQLYVFHTADPAAELRQDLAGFHASTSNQDNANILLVLVPTDPTVENMAPSVHATTVVPAPVSQIHVGYTPVTAPTAPTITSPAPVQPTLPANPIPVLHYTDAADRAAVTPPTLNTSTVHLADAPTITLQSPSVPSTPDQGGGIPGTPSTPTEPSTPTTPGQPNNPGTPNTPGNPNQPGQPGQPGNPGKPNTPGNPNQPGQPGNPTTPVLPGHGTGHADHTPGTAGQSTVGSAATRTQANSSARLLTRRVGQPVIVHWALSPTSANRSNKGRLPQTGDQHESGLSVLGAVLTALTAVFSWTLTDRKQRN